MQNLLATFLPFGWAPAAIAFVAMMVVYHLWHSSLLFGRAWIRHSGIRPGDLRPADTRRLFITSFIARAVTALLIGALAGHGADNPVMLFSAVGFIWLFLMFEQLMGILSRREPIALFFLVTLRILVTLMVGALVYYLWSTL